MTKTPYGAAEIIALRSKGKRPADMVLVSFIGPLNGERNPVVIARSERAYDWRFVLALPLLVVARTDTKHLATAVQAIENGRPATLGVWFADRQDGINVVIEGYRPRSKAGRRMLCSQRADLAGLGADRPRSECLVAIAGQVKARAMANADRFDAALVEMAQAGFRQLFGGAWGVAA